MKGAVVSLGFQRLRDIVISCSILRLMPVGQTQINPVTFWEHSLGCALVSRHFARKIEFPNPDKAYLGGLLHDLGVLVNLWVLPKEFGAVVHRAQAEHAPLHTIEFEMLGITHCETGRILAERWDLTADLIEVVSSHHDAPAAKTHRALVALVSLSATCSAAWAISATDIRNSVRSTFRRNLPSRAVGGVSYPCDVRLGAFHV